MATGRISEVVQQHHGVVLVADAPDGQLLERFISGRDGAALEALVRRHGPMVWNVCRRVIHNHQDAEDAFQSTFLVLVRKAASIAPKEMVGNWLYGVAHQTALKSNAIAAKRRTREKQVTEMPEPAMTEQECWNDLQPVLDEELSRLSDKYRVVIVLCDLEGKTRTQAAQQLGWPEGTVAGRLSRARKTLARRLVKRGVVFSAGALAAVLSQQAASAVVPATLASNTILAATHVAAGQIAAAGVISPSVAALTEGVLKTMLMTKLKIAAASLLMLVTLTTAIVARGQIRDKRNAREVAEKQPAPAQEKDQPKSVTNSLDMKFAWIAPGTFMMGTPKGEDRGQFVNDETQHKVTLTKGFYMGVYPVTQEQWQALMGNNPSKFKGEKNLPVDTVSWDDCQEFIKKLREKDKQAYRLPTEAEREYACRAGTTTPFYFGDTISTDQANFDGTYVYGNGKPGVDREKTTPVGSFPANAWGMYDMHGNVAQWCQDWLGDYPKEAVVDPQGPEKGKDRVVRGGSWYGAPQYVRSAFRFSVEPAVRHDRCGLRVCYFPE